MGVHIQMTNLHVAHEGDYGGGYECLQQIKERDENQSHPNAAVQKKHTIVGVVDITFKLIAAKLRKTSLMR